MASGKSAAKLAASDHDYAPMETSGVGKRKSPASPAKSSTPPTKVKTVQDQSLDKLTEAITKLTTKVDDFGEQLTKTAVMVANVTKLAEINCADIKECKTKIKVIENEIPQLVKENTHLKERVTELERYKRRWNLKIQGMKEKDNEKTREDVLDILSHIAPHGLLPWGPLLTVRTDLGNEKMGEADKSWHPFQARLLQRGQRSPRSSMAKDGASTSGREEHLLQRCRGYIDGKRVTP
ncbi:hypothetical protein WMY93_026113 [Mugilogobius chulae]|uniref:Uncharacterized protein n=1 Tax=Mugilogobius chulae TaxID=88201 RepID=A0AAW0N391_9GOBI